MDKNLLYRNRASHINSNEIYFWTATIHQWKHLLEKDEYKEVVISSLNYLSGQGKIDVYAFVIMPNHIHLIWRINEMNGKESPHGSFLKYTAHLFQKMLQKEESGKLATYKIRASNKQYEFWQPQSLAIPLFTKEVAMQKLHYLHNNPLAEHWQLVKDPCDYKYSSARYYYLDEKNFSFLKDLWEVI